MKNKGFIMVETVIVLAVLTIGLIVLYSSYALLLRNTTFKAQYDNPEHLYRSYYLNKYINESDLLLDTDTIKVLYDKDKSIALNEDLKYIADNFNVERIYLTRMNPRISNEVLLSFDGTTIDYLNSINNYNGSNRNNFRLIFKYKDYYHSNFLLNFASLNTGIDAGEPAPSNLKLVKEDDTGESDSDNITKLSEVRVKGNTSSDTLVEYFKNGVSTNITARSDKNGVFTASIPLNLGINKITAKTVLTDGYSNSSAELIIELDNISPVITAENTAIELFSEFNPLLGVSGSDNLDGNITSKIKANHSVNTQIPNEYPVNYSLTDIAGNSTTKEIIVKVTDLDYPAFIAEYNFNRTYTYTNVYTYLSDHARFLTYQNNNMIDVAIEYDENAVKKEYSLDNINYQTYEKPIELKSTEVLYAKATYQNTHKISKFYHVSGSFNVATRTDQAADSAYSLSMSGPCPYKIGYAESGRTFTSLSYSKSKGTSCVGYGTFYCPSRTYSPAVPSCFMMPPSSDMVFLPGGLMTMLSYTSRISGPSCSWGGFNFCFGTNPTTSGASGTCSATYSGTVIYYRINCEYSRYNIILTDNRAYQTENL